MRDQHARPLEGAGGLGAPSSLSRRSMRFGKILSLAAMLAWGLLAAADAAAQSDGLPASEEAWRLLLAGRVEEAVSASGRLAALGDDPSRAVAVRVEALVEAGRAGEAEAFCAEQAARNATGIAALCAGVRALAAADPAGAEARLREALADAETGGDAQLRLVSLEKLGAVLVALGQLPPAVEILEEALPLAEERELPLATTALRLSLGRAQIRSREVEAAAGHLEEARAVAIRLGIDRWQGDAALVLSSVRRLQDDLDGALALREEALQAFERAGDLRGQAQASHFIGVVHVMRGELTRAMRRITRGLELAREAGASDVEAGCLGDLAGINFLAGDFDRALAQYREAVRLTENVWRQGYLGVNIGSILAQERRHEEALAVYEEARAKLAEAGDRRHEAVALQAIGQSLCELHRYEEGLSALDEAIAFDREYEMPTNEAYALHYKGHALIALDRLDEARRVLAAASELAGQGDYFDIVQSVALGQAIVARKQGQLAEALRHLEDALAVIDEVRRRSGGSQSVQSGFFGEADKTYAEMIYLLAMLDEREPDAGWAERAFDLSQRKKARALLDLLAEAEVDLRCRAEPRYRQREQELLARLAELDGRIREAGDGVTAELEAELAAVEAQLDLAEADLREADPRYAELRYPQPVNLAGVQAEVLEEGELLLEYALGDSASHVWAVTRDDFRFATLPRRSEIVPLVRAVLPLVRDYNVTGGDVGYFVPAATALGRALLEPVRDLLPAARRIVVAPDGILHYLPLEILLAEDPPASARRFGDLPFLVEGHDVVHVPSISALARLRASRGGDAGDAGALLLVGAPRLDAPQDASIFALAAGGQAPPPLPFAAGELAALAALRPAAQVTAAGAEATIARLEEACRSGPYRYVHFATHGLFNEQRPQYSGLVLSPDPATGDDGFLATGRVFGLDLPCDQVVLSACASALGEQVTGEGLVGLTRGFIYAGARSVVAALWNVSGQATAAFMADFYGGMLASPAPDRAHALAEAKRRFLAGEIDAGLGDVDPAHPYFWAAFVLTGAPR